MIYLFLIFLTLGLYSASNKINLYLFKEKGNILINTFIFSFFFGLIYLFNSYLFILNINGKYFSYLFFAIIVIISLFQLKEINDYFKFIKLNYILKNKIIFVILLFYFFIILLPVADEDSLRYHLEIGKKINNGSFYDNTWLDYITLGAHEFINSFALYLKFEHISSYSNFIYLLFAIISNIYILKKYKVGSGISGGVILLSSPYLIALISSQKFYFFPCFIVSYSIAYLFLEKKINFKCKYLILFLNIFCVIIKPTFLPYLILVVFLLLYKSNGYKNKILYLIYATLLAIIFYYPIFFIKLKIYNDPFLPYISLNAQNSDWLADYNFYLTGFNMDFTDKFNNLYVKYLLIPIKLIFPLQFSDIFKTLGLGILLVFSFNYKKNNYLFILSIFFIFAVIIINNFQSRWFLPLLIFISIFARIDKSIILRKLIWLQLIGISCVLIPMSFVILAQNIGIIDKKLVLDKVFQSHKIINHINNKYENEKIFSKLNYFYYFDNVVPVYYSKIVKKFDENYYKKNEETTKLLLWPYKSRPAPSIEASDVSEFVNENLTCKKLKKIDEFSIGVGRFFLNHAKNRIKVILYKLNC